MLLILVPFINLQKTLFAFHLIIDTATENESPPTFVTLITDSFIDPAFGINTLILHCLLYTSDAADEEDSVDLGGRRIIKKKKRKE